MDSGQDLGVTVQKLDGLVPVDEGSEVIEDVARLAAHIGVHRKIPLASLYEVTSAWKCELEGALLIAPREAPRMVPVQVRGDYRVDLIRAYAESLQCVQHSFGLAQPDLLGALLAELGPDARLADDDAPVLACDGAHDRAVDHVLAVRGFLLFPQDFGHDAEHQAAVGLPAVGEQEVKLEVAQLHCALYARRNGDRGDQDVCPHQGLRRRAGSFRPRPAGFAAGGLRLPGSQRVVQDYHDPPRSEER